MLQSRQTDLFADLEDTTNKKSSVVDSSNETVFMQRLRSSCTRNFQATKKSEVIRQQITNTMSNGALRNQTGRKRSQPVAHLSSNYRSQNNFSTQIHRQKLAFQDTGQNFPQAISTMLFKNSNSLGPQKNKQRQSLVTDHNSAIEATTQVGSFSLNLKMPVSMPFKKSNLKQKTQVMKKENPVILSNRQIQVGTTELKSNQEAQKQKSRTNFHPSILSSATGQIENYQTPQDQITIQQLDSPSKSSLPENTSNKLTHIAHSTIQSDLNKSIKNRKSTTLKSSQPRSPSKVGSVNSSSQTMLLSQAASYITQKSNLKQLQNTLTKLNKLVGTKNADHKGESDLEDAASGQEEQKQNVYQSVLTSMKSKQQMTVKNASVYKHDYFDDDDEDCESYDSQNLSKREKALMDLEVKRIKQKRLKLTNAPNTGDFGKSSMISSKESFQHRESSRQSHRSFYNNKQSQMDLQIRKPRSTHAKHLQQLKAIEDRLRTDLSDSRVKKEHLELMSTSLSKLSKESFQPALNRTASSYQSTCRQQKFQLQRLWQQQEQERSKVASQQVILRRSRNIGNHQDDPPEFLMRQSNETTEFKPSNHTVMFTEPDQTMPQSAERRMTAQHSKRANLMNLTSETDLSTAKFDDSQEKQCLQKRAGSLEVINKVGYARQRTQQSLQNLLEKAGVPVKKGEGHNKSSLKEVQRQAAEKKNLVQNRSYVLSVKACLKQAKKKRGPELNNQQHYLTTSIKNSGTGHHLLNLKRDSHSSMTQIAKKASAVHDLSYKLHSNFKLTTDRNNLSYQNWIKGKMKKINTEEILQSDFNEDAFMEQYFANIDPNQSSSMQKVIEMTKLKTLLGPGYYQVSHESSEKVVPSVKFEAEKTSILNPRRYADYLKELEQIKLNKEKRKRSQRLIRRREKNPKEALMAELVNIHNDGGQIDKSDAQLLVQRICEQSKQPYVSSATLALQAQQADFLGQSVAIKARPNKTSSSPNKINSQNNVMSKVPRWGAMTFEEKIENDMVLNRMKDIHTKPHNKNFLQINMKHANGTGNHSIDDLGEMNVDNCGNLSPGQQRSLENSLEHKDKQTQQRDALITKLQYKEHKRQMCLRLGQQQQVVKESVLELFTLNAFLHSVAETYLTRFSLQHKKDAFSRKAVLLFWVIGKFKIKAKTVRIKLADTKVKLTIAKWVKRWRAKRHIKMKDQILNFMEERATKVPAFLHTAQKIYCYVVHIQRVFRRFLRRKKYMMCVYSMSWIIAEKRYLAQLKKSEQAAKEKIQKMSINEIIKFQQTSVPLKVRLFYVNQYYDMARQAYKKQHSDYRVKINQIKAKLKGAMRRKSTFVNQRAYTIVDQIAEYSKHAEDQGLKQLVDQEPMFQSHIVKNDLVQMIIDALRFRVNWPNIERGQFFYSPALRRIAKLWYDRVGLRYANDKFEEQNQRVTQVKMRKAEKLYGRKRRNALQPNDKNFPQEKLAKFIATHELAQSKKKKGQDQDSD